MPRPVRGTVTLDVTISLVANIGGLEALQDETPMTVYPGQISTTIQVGTTRIKGTTVTLESGDDAGLITAATLAELKALQWAAAASAYTDTLGNVGTVILKRVSAKFERGGQTEDLVSYRIEAVWVTITQVLGVAYTGG